MKKIALILLMLIPVQIAFAQDLVILHTNDTHSHIDPVRSGIQAGMGGVIERSVYIDSVRHAMGRKNVILVDAGDFSQGTSYFTLLNGDIEVELLNEMKYDVVCLGNHEFDNGIDELVRRTKNMKFPLICANYDFSGSELEHLVKPYAIVKKAGLKIGFIGLLTDLGSVVAHDIAAVSRYLDPVEVTNRYAEYLKEVKKCDMVICLTHLGYTGEEVTDPILGTQVRNVDMIIGGHSHTFLDSMKHVKDLDGKDVPIVTNGCWGLYVGKVDIWK